MREIRAMESSRNRDLRPYNRTHLVRAAWRNLPMLSIRPANAGDVPLLTTLIHEFAEFEHLPVTVSEANLLRDGFGERPRFRVLMAEWEGESAGYAFFFDYYSTF